MPRRRRDGPRPSPGRRNETETTIVKTKKLLRALDLDPAKGDLEVHSPIDGALLARLKPDRPAKVTARVGRAAAAFAEWRPVPAPRRGELIRLLGEELREAKDALGRLV